MPLTAPFWSETPPPGAESTPSHSERSGGTYTKVIGYIASSQGGEYTLILRKVKEYRYRNIFMIKVISYNTFPPPEYPALRKVKGYNHYQVN